MQPGELTTVRVIRLWQAGHDTVQIAQWVFGDLAMEPVVERVINQYLDKKVGARHYAQW